MVGRLRARRARGRAGRNGPAGDVGRRIAEVDGTLLDAIPSQTTANDRLSLIALHAAVRDAHGPFAYLEIGSHLGGSLQALIADPLCSSVISIDSRPASQPDERGFDYPYPGNSTEAMLALLGEVPGADLAKVRTFDCDASEVDLGGIGERPRLCFVDGEHTDEAVRRDAAFCFEALDERGGVIVFHDIGVVYRGLRTWLDERLSAGEQWIAPFVMPDSLFAIEVGAAAVTLDPRVRARTDRAWEAALWLLVSNDRYRQFYRGWPARALRRLGLASEIELR